MKVEKKYKGEGTIFKILNFLFSRFFIITILILFQIIFLMIAVLKLTEMFFYLYGILTLISLAGLVLFVLSIIPVLKQGKNSNLNYNNQRKWWSC